MIATYTNGMVGGAQPYRETLSFDQHTAPGGHRFDDAGPRVDLRRLRESREQARRVPILVDISSDLFTAIQTFRLERGNVNTALRSSTAVDTDSQNEIAKLRVGSAKALDSALTKLRALKVDDAGPVIEAIGESRNALAQQRHEVDAALQQPKDRRPGSLGANWVAAIGDLQPRVKIRGYPKGKP